ncbi:conserved hypothetical protein, partial [Trichinella spiralis]|uniref:hypothetical protein n=1 Tax=Trichinella spiralis TaxID=6334 RepID=UPI0001EFE2B9
FSSSTHFYTHLNSMLADAPYSNFEMWTITSATSSTARQDPFQVFEGGNYDNITSTFRNLPVDIANESFSHATIIRLVDELKIGKRALLNDNKRRTPLILSSRLVISVWSKFFFM